jgi:type I restriction enzyme S subunit
VNNHAHVLKPKRGNLEYLAAMMEQLNYMPWISGAAQPKLTQDRLMSIAVVVPPVAEQDGIMATAKAETVPLQAAIERASGEIALLNEYQTRLIVDVVTGKLDVRDAAAKLHDEPDELTMPDDTEVTEVGDEPDEPDPDPSTIDGEA